MLLLERQEGELINIGNDIVIKLIRIKHGAHPRAVIGIAAPKHIAIMRAEAVLTAPRAHQPHLPSQR
jgi:carbon storage regulator CsrA